MKRASFLILLGCLSATALATTYVRVEKDGSKTYSDRPLPGGQPVDIQPAQTYSAPSTPSADSTHSREEQQVLAAASFQYACALAPRNDETFQNPESVTLAVQLTPALRPGDQVKFSVDGSTLPNADNLPSTVMPMPDRGTHHANVQITDRSGRVICDSGTTFHVQRTGTNSPARQPVRPPPRPSPPRPTPH
jgi:hypothetical protein